VYVLLNTYTKDIPLIDQVGLTPDRFNTVIGLIVILIMVLSPEGLVGILDRLSRGRGLGSPNEHSVEQPTTSDTTVHTGSGHQP
jgi:branched-chain amino acid transport system permease protein